VFIIDNCRFEASIPRERRLAQHPKNVHRRRDSLFCSEVTVSVRACCALKRESGSRQEYDNLGPRVVHDHDEVVVRNFLNCVAIGGTKTYVVWSFGKLKKYQRTMDRLRLPGPKQKTTDLIRVSCLQILARKIFIRNPNPGSFHRAVLPDGQRLCVIHVGRCLIKRCEVSLHCYGIFCLKQTTPTAVLAGLLVLQDRVRCFG
jgi:hypothetical protein